MLKLAQASTVMELELEEVELVSKCVFEVVHTMIYFTAITKPNTKQLILVYFVIPKS